VKRVGKGEGGKERRDQKRKGLSSTEEIQGNRKGGKVVPKGKVQRSKQKSAKKEVKVLIASTKGRKGRGECYGKGLLKKRGSRHRLGRQKDERKKRLGFAGKKEINNTRGRGDQGLAPSSSLRTCIGYL